MQTFRIIKLDDALTDVGTVQFTTTMASDNLKYKRRHLDRQLDILTWKPVNWDRIKYQSFKVFKKVYM